MWTELLSVGVESIDAQHKTLIDHANQLFEAGKNHKTKEVIGELLEFLDQYTRTHFRDEEKYMDSIGYPELSDQKRYHAEFINALQNLKKQYESSGGNLTVIINANKLVVEWLTNHISVQDKKIGKFAAGLKK
jgi:hemerythrin